MYKFRKQGDSDLDVRIRVTTNKRQSQRSERTFKCLRTTSSVCCTPPSAPVAAQMTSSDGGSCGAPWSSAVLPSSMARLWMSDSSDSCSRALFRGVGGSEMGCSVLRCEVLACN